MMLAPCMNSLFQARLTLGGDVADWALHDAEVPRNGLPLATLSPMSRARKLLQVPNGP